MKKVVMTFNLDDNGFLKTVIIDENQTTVPDMIAFEKLIEVAHNDIMARRTAIEA